jgi:hypothetical protein
MRFDARLTGHAAVLVREHRAMLERLPATFHASVLVELQKWPLLFAPEQAYQRALVEHLARLPQAELQHTFAAIVRLEAEAGCPSIRTGDPASFQDEAQARLRKTRRLYEWRKEIDGVFQKIDPILEERLYPTDAPRRLVVQLYGTGIAVQSDKLWDRFKGMGFRIPLTLPRTPGPEAFLRQLLTGREDDGGVFVPTVMASAAKASAAASPLDAWIIESGDTLSALCDTAAPAVVTGLSYERLRGYRDQLTRALYAKIQSGVASPQEFAAYARSLKIAPGPGVLLYGADILQAFVRDVFLLGNGTLFVNNTFAEWASVQALKRAQPRMLVTRYGVRDKMKPFSSLLLFSQPRASDQIPLIEDPVGSFVDVEQLSYYVCLHAEKSAAYRKRTLYLLLAEGIDEMLAIRSDMLPSQALPSGMPPADGHGAKPAALPVATLADVHQTMTRWLGLLTPAPAGRAIAPLVT